MAWRTLRTISALRGQKCMYRKLFYAEVFVTWIEYMIESAVEVSYVNGWEYLTSLG